MVLAAVATVLLIDTHNLLIGESASAELVRSVRDAVRDHEALIDYGEPATVPLGPDSIVVALRLGFTDALSARQAVEAIGDVRRRIRERHPDVRRVLVDTRPPASDARQDQHE